MRAFVLVLCVGVVGISFVDRLCGQDTEGERAELLRAAANADVERSLSIAKRLSEIGAAGDAAKVYERAAGLPAITAAEFRARGKARHYSKQFPLAIDDYSAALEIDGTDIESRMGRFLLLIHLTQYERAQLDIDELLAVNPDFVSGLRWRAVCWYGRKEVDNAISDYTRVLELAPDDLESLRNRGVMYYERGQYAKALEDWDRAIKVDPRSIYTLRRLAKIWASCPIKEYRNGDAAVKAAQVLVAHPKAEPRDHVLLAAAYAETGDFKEAMKHQEHALATKRDDPSFQASEKSRLELYRVGKPYHDQPPMDSVVR